MGGTGLSMPSYNPTTGATAGGKPAGDGSQAAMANSGMTPQEATNQQSPEQGGATSGFQLATPTQVPGTSLTGVPAWMDSYQASGGGDLNSWFQKMQGGYADMSVHPDIPQQNFAPPPPPPAAAAAAPAAEAAKQKMPYMWVAPQYGQGTGYVSDQWNFQTGSSQPTVTMNRGDQTGGGYYYDPTTGNKWMDKAGTQKYETGLEAFARLHGLNQGEMETKYPGWGW